MIAWWVAVATVVAVVLMAVSHAFTTVVLGACVFFTLIGPASALRALTVATLVIYANPAVIKLGEGDGILLRVALLTATLRILLTMRSSDLPLVWPIWLFGAIAALTSYETSPAVAISIMKVITFVAATTVVLSAYNRLRPTQLKSLQSWLLTVGLTVIALSVLTRVKPGLGDGLNGGLQGLLDQPQALGVFVAPFAAWSFAGILMMRRRGTSLEPWIALGTLLVIILTRARTSGVALLISLSVIMISRFVSQRRGTQGGIGRPIVVSALLVAALLAVASTGRVTEWVKEFAYKGTEKQSHDLGEAFYSSRGGGVLLEWNNFLTSPLIGHGFGVYPDGEFPSGVVVFHGIPISAPVEKGFLPTAILEEGGIVGAIALIFVIVWLGRYGWRGADLRWRAFFVACIAVNVGECVFLSPGGIGLLTWIFMGLGIFAHRIDAAVAKAPGRTLQRRMEAPLSEGAPHTKFAA